MFLVAPMVLVHWSSEGHSEEGSDDGDCELHGGYVVNELLFCKLGVVIIVSASDLGSERRRYQRTGLLLYF